MSHPFVEPRPGDGTDHAIRRFQWLGRDEMHLGCPSVSACGDIVIGCYGGNPDSGAYYNEDGALVWRSADGAWELALLLDAHASADSAALVLETIAREESALGEILAQPVERVFASMERHLIELFGSPLFRATCRKMRGETACLICVRKANFLWWFNVGDCVLYLLHPDLAAHGQFCLNQRSFFEWIGQVNTFDLSVPCYTSGVRELRSGTNVIVLSTDGLLLNGSSRFAEPIEAFRWFASETRNVREEIHARVERALCQVHESLGRDSATVIAWVYENNAVATQPSILENAERASDIA